MVCHSGFLAVYVRVVIPVSSDSMLKLWNGTSMTDVAEAQW